MTVVPGDLADTNASSFNDANDETQGRASRMGRGP